MSAADYWLVDADNHYYEPADAFTRHIDPKHRGLAVRPAAAGAGTKVVVGDRPFTFMANGFPAEVERINRPGSLREMIRGNTGDVDHTQPIQREYVDREARLAVMDEQGVEKAWLFPSLGVCVEHFMKDDIPATYANIRAFNDWLQDDWGFAYKDRIYASPLLSLLDVDLAVAELERVLAQGARLVHLRPGPAGGRSPADPVFDPFWARVEEADVGVAFHISESGYNEMMSVQWGEDPNPTSKTMSAFQWTCFYGDRVISDTLAILILHNLFGRFPGLRVASVENGSLWVPYLLKALDKNKGMGRNGPWPGGYVKGRPSEIFKEHVYISPYHEEDAVALGELIGVERVLFGSDFPHPEGLAVPSSFADQLATLSAEDRRAVMRDNALRFMGEAV
ncbi:MAG: amidohydrolase [Acidobacteria bacterium]|nr:amidohydrolase [Acidobacteriota bacterium]